MKNNFLFFFFLFLIVSTSLVSADSEFSFSYIGTNDFYISIFPSSEQFNQMEGYGVNFSLINYNVTSNNVLGDSDVWDLGKVNISTDLLSFVFTANFKSNCSARLDVEQNYTEMITANPNYKLATTNTTDHAGTLFDSISEGEHALYISCLTVTTGEGAAPGNSSSGPLNITLTFPTLANQINYTNERLTYVHSAQFDQDGQCTLWGNWTGVWAQNESVGATADIRFNFTAINHQILDTNILWSLNCTNIGGFESWGTNVSYTTGNLDLFLNGLAQGRKYEFGTHANLSLTSSGTACLSIYHPNYGEDFSCGSSISVNFSTDPLFIYRFIENTNLVETVNMSTNYTVYFNDIDNRTGLLGFNLSVFTNDVITDLTLSYKGINLAQLIGDLNGSNLEVNRFEDRTSAKNLTYREAGTQFVNLNVTTAGTATSCSLNISGTDTDKENAFSYVEDFNDTEFINTTAELSLDSPVGIYDTFNWNVTGRWSSSISCDYSCSSNWQPVREGYLYIFSDAPNAEGGASLTRVVTSADFNLANRSYVNMNLTTSATQVCAWGCGSPCSHAVYIRLTDGTNSVTISTSESISSNLTLEKSSESIWRVYQDGTFLDTIDTSSLNPSTNWNFLFGAESRSSHTGRQGTDFDCVSTATINVEKIETSGIFPKFNFSTGVFNLKGNMRSTILNYTKEQLSAATLFSSEVESSGDNITYYLSNDNQTTWEEVTQGINHIFTSIGKSISYMANFSLDDNQSSMNVEELRVDIIPASARDISLDVGNDNIIEFNFSEELNSSNSPLTVNLTRNAINDYINFNCDGTLCEIPISISAGSSSIVGLDTISCNIDVEPMALNKSIIEDVNGSIPIDVNYSSPGTINLTTLRLKFYGEQVINITASFGSNAVSFFLNVMYSSFSVAINPPNIDYWDIGPNLYSWVQSYVPPFGNGNGDGNPFWNLTRTIWDEPIDVYIKYNESVNTCATTWFSGLNETNTSLSFNVTINTTTQILFNNVTDKIRNNVSTWTNISCAAENSTLLLPYFCFSGFCTDCVKTEDWVSTCDWTG